jgi:hypothetical protein
VEEEKNNAKIMPTKEGGMGREGLRTDIDRRLAADDFWCERRERLHVDRGCVLDGEAVGLLFRVAV